ALETREGHGVWGGLNETERRAILKRKALEAS
ncbi:MAG: Transcription factor WhiB, partial [Actinomycetia bacterium]|nr:Transcription factor WhiB [Actinomycetes bacterium]